jgi:preprotein translocase subunit SecE
MSNEPEDQPEDAALKTAEEPSEASLALAGETAIEPQLEGEGLAPSQLGTSRFVFATFFGGGILIAFMATKIGSTVWHALGRKWPTVGEPRDEWLYPAAIALGIAIPLYYFRRPDARQYAEEVAEELAQVTWPSKEEVTNSTVIVVMTTLVSTVFFALLDQFWRFVTDKIYGTGI